MLQTDTAKEIVFSIAFAPTNMSLCGYPVLALYILSYDVANILRQPELLCLTPYCRYNFELGNCIVCGTLVVYLLNMMFLLSCNMCAYVLLLHAFIFKSSVFNQ